jgi:hypothetical protein
MTNRAKNIYGWTGVELLSEHLTVGLTPSIGGRIMSLKYKGQELLFTDSLHSGETFHPQTWNNLSESKISLGFRLWGGDKTWIAPQKDWLESIPPLDLDAAPYSLSWDQGQAVMTSLVCRETGIQIIRRVGLSLNEVYLVEEIHNRSAQPIHRGLWNVTQVQRPCVFVVPSHPKGLRSYHHEDTTLLPYPGDLSASKGHVEVNCNHHDLFKIGGILSEGKIRIYIPCPQGRICWEKSFNHDPLASFAHGSEVEIYNSPVFPYSEIELHAPFRVLKPGECSRLEQVWKISLIN